MYKIAIISGGTGSIALQTGIINLLGYENIKMDIIINAYDNGKSTGMCRKLCQDSILGPSDLRKNQITQFLLKNQEIINSNCNSKEAKIYNFFELRLTASSAEEYYNLAGCKIDELKNILSGNDIKYFHRLLDDFFYKNGRMKEKIKKVDFIDFSLSNIFYSQAAVNNNFSLRKAGSEMAEILNIKNNVHLISDVNLYLKAETKSGYIIGDEGEIVCWNNPNDPIKRIILENIDGKEYIPHIDEKIADDEEKCADIIKEADIIIFSSGTQWSSLIPTYIHYGFKEIIKKAKAKKYIIMNNAEDNDMKGINADQILNTINSFVDVSNFKVVINKNASEGLNKIINCDDYISAKLSEKGEKKHNPALLATTIMSDFFRLDKKKSAFMI